MVERPDHVPRPDVRESFPEPDARLPSPGWRIYVDCRGRPFGRSHKICRRRHLPSRQRHHFPRAHTHFVAVLESVRVKTLERGASPHKHRWLTEPQEKLMLSVPGRAASAKRRKTGWRPHSACRTDAHPGGRVATTLAGRGTAQGSREALQPGASVAAIADRQGVARDLLYHWLRQVPSRVTVGDLTPSSAGPAMRKICVDQRRRVLHGRAQIATGAQLSDGFTYASISLAVLLRP